MAENEAKKEKASFGMSIWFIIFVVYLAISLVYMISQNQTIDALNKEIEDITYNYNQTITDSNKRSEDILNDLMTLIEKYAVKEEESIPNLVGAYTGVTNETANYTMTLTLSENNVASLSVVNESGDSLINGTYSVADNTVNFTSEDGLTTYTYTVVNETTLELVNENLNITLVK